MGFQRVEHSLATEQQKQQKRPKKAPSLLSPFEIIAKKKVHEPGSGPSPDTEPSGISIMKFPASRTVKNKVLLFTNDPGYVILL